MRGVKTTIHQFNGPDEIQIIALCDKLADQLDNLFTHTIYQQLKRLAGMTVVDVPRDIIVDETRSMQKYCTIFTRCNDTIIIETVNSLNKNTADWVLLQIPDDIKPRKCPEMRDMRHLVIDYTLKSFKTWIDEWIPEVKPT